MENSTVNANFFATGSAQMKFALDSNYLPNSGYLKLLTPTPANAFGLLDSDAINYVFGMNLDYVPNLKVKDINLSAEGQTLQEGYQIAKEVFEQTAEGTIKYVLIELAPYHPTINQNNTPPIYHIL